MSLNRVRLKTPVSAEDIQAAVDAARGETQASADR